MALVPARIIKAEDATKRSFSVQHATPVGAKLVRRELLQAQAAAAEIVASAEKQAAASLQAATEAARGVEAEAKRRGYEEGLAEAARRAIHLVDEQQRDASRSVSRIVQLARLLAERLIGRSLQIDEATVRDMAMTLLGEVRGARRVQLTAHPEDARVIQGALDTRALAADVLVDADSGLARGDFRLVTDIGTLEGSLGSRVAVLAKKLEEGLESK